MVLPGELDAVHDRSGVRRGVADGVRRGLLIDPRALDRAREIA